MFKEVIDYNGKKMEISWVKSTNFEGLNPVVQVYGVCFDKTGKIIIIKTTKKWCLPGGTPEINETSEQTLRREVDEEASIDIKNILPLGYQKVKELENGKEIYQLRYFALVDKIKPQKIDPATNIIPERKFIEPKEFSHYCDWGKIGEEVIKKAQEVFVNL